LNNHRVQQNGGCARKMSGGWGLSFLFKAIGKKEAKNCVGSGFAIQKIDEKIELA